MKPPHGYSEDELVEQPAIELFRELGFEATNCMNEKIGENATLGRQTTNEVVLVSRLREALEELNPELPSPTIGQVIAELTQDRSSVSAVHANREIYRVLKDGVRVTIRDAEEERVERVKVIDWTNPRKNKFFLASQFW